MNDFVIEAVSAQPVLEVAGRVSAMKIPKLLGDAFPGIKDHVDQCGGTLAGPPFARYLDLDWESIRNDGPLAQLWQLFTAKFSVRAGFATAAPVPAGAGMEAGEFAPGRCVRGTHFGAYHKVGETYKRMARWAEENGVTLANESFERYVNDPTEVPKDQIETHVFVPLRE
ncbi:MAG: GyrI-like domain-containing protein [Pseudomonadota bacterium]